jgi:hypothetical protein
MGLKWPFLPQSETRETLFRAFEFSICANLSLLRCFGRSRFLKFHFVLVCQLLPFLASP